MRTQSKRSRTSRTRPVPLGARPLIGAGILSGILIGALAPLATGQGPLAPTEEQVETTTAILRRLNRMHVRDFALNDALSSRVLDRYVEYLDGRREILLASDVAQFEPLRTKLDDALLGGDLEPAFMIFRVYRERRLDRAQLMVRLAESDLSELSFEVADELEIDREEAAWSATRAAWDDLWRRRFKNDVLNLRLAGRSDAEVAKILGRRYTNELARIERMDAGDVHSLYINSLTATLDPHTQYFPPRAAEDFDMQMSLSFEGIGARLGNDDGYVEITEIIPGGPAEGCNCLDPGDRIVSVAQGAAGEDAEEAVDIVGWAPTEAVDLIRGPAASTVRLEILSAEASEGGSTRIVSLVRDTIQLEDQAAQKHVVTLEREGVEYKIGFIELPAFYMDFQAYSQRDPNYRSSTRDVAKLLSELTEEGVDGVVLDLRSNSGGSLMEATGISSLFLGERPVVQVHDSRGKTQVLDGEYEALYKGPMAVLVNRLSASASEILAGAIQDHGRGLVLGTRTFGKGSVQTLMPLENGELKITQALFYRVTGAGTQRNGISPDVEFPPIYDPEAIGEDTLEDALPWDMIEATKFQRNRVTRSLVRELRERHDARAANDPELTALRDSLARVHRERERKTLSLVESERRKLRDQADAEVLAIENARRAALGLESLESLDDAADEEPPESDAYQLESAEVLTDFVEQMRARVVKRR